MKPKLHKNIKYDMSLHKFCSNGHKIKTFFKLGVTKLDVLSRHGYIIHMTLEDISQKLIEPGYKVRKRCQICDSINDTTYQITENGPINVCRECRKRYNIKSIKSENSV